MRMVRNKRGQEGKSVICHRRDGSCFLLHGVGEGRLGKPTSMMARAVVCFWNPFYGKLRHPVWKSIKLFNKYLVKGKGP